MRRSASGGWFREECPVELLVVEEKTLDDPRGMRSMVRGRPQTLVRKVLLDVLADLVHEVFASRLEIGPPAPDLELRQPDRHTGRLEIHRGPEGERFHQLQEVLTPDE